MAFLKLKYGFTLLFFLELLLHSTNAFEQNSKYEKGFYPVKNFPVEVYKGLPSNWSVLQDKRGIIYSANLGGGIFEFDGTNWNEIKPVTGSIPTRSLGIDSRGRIYIGGIDDLGFLKPDNSGNLTFNSLLSQVNDGDKKFGDVWNTLIFDNKVIFQTIDKLFVYSNDSLQVYHANTEFYNSFLVNNELFVFQKDIGLMRFHQDSLIFLKGSELFIKDDIYALMPYHDNVFLAATSKKGIFLVNYFVELNKIVLIPKKTDIDKFLSVNQVYQCIPVDSQRYSIGTFGGSRLIDKNGQFLGSINQESGMIDENIKYQFLDQNRNLWLGLSNGISDVQINSPITVYNDKHLLKGTVESISRLNGILYIASSIGAFSLHTFDRKTNQIPQFKKLEGIPGSETWIVRSYQVGNSPFLLVEQNSNILECDDSDGESHTIYDGVPWAVYQSKRHPELFYIGVEDGVFVLKREQNRWKTLGKISGIGSRITQIMEDIDGNVWLSAEMDGIYFIAKRDFDIAHLTDIKPAFYTSENGLPKGPYIFESYESKILFGTAKGIYNFEKDESQFISDININNKLGNHLRYIHRMSVDPSGKLWLVTYINEEERDEVGFFDYDTDSNLFWNPTPFLGDIKGQINAIYHDPDGVTWLGGSEGLFRYDSKVRKNYNPDFNCLIRKVKLGEDSTVFYGTYFDEKGNVSLNQPEALKPILDFEYNSLIFNYSAMNVDVGHTTRYSYFLEGYDKKWSDWTTKTEKEYTNLQEGDYVFHVKAKTIYNHESKEGIYAFEILPPWYRTWLAYVGFILAAFALVYLIVTQYTKYLREVIREKTAEITEQKDEIEKKNQEITASIKYAERIQKAVVPSHEKAQEYLPDHFIMWRPRDIVSGDFWWMTQKNGVVVIVAADCTGHGVPGAFLSMLGISFLNEIVNKSDITTANVILDQLRRHVKTTLKQTGKEGEAKDGMDIALVIIDEENMRIQFAGAYNPLYLIRNGELLETKADRNPIGIYVKEVDSFTNNIIEVQKGDTFYIFSDGFVDQFGGEDGGKYKAKRFKQLLLDIQPLTMNGQGSKLYTAVDDWRGRFEQVDDILIIGVRM